MNAMTITMITLSWPNAATTLIASTMGGKDWMASSIRMNAVSNQPPK